MALSWLRMATSWTLGGGRAQPGKRTGCVLGIIMSLKGGGMKVNICNIDPQGGGMRGIIRLRDLKGN